MKTLSPSRLDLDTPKWPEVRITLGDQPTVTVSGVITPVDDQAAAITRCAEQARTLGRPIRARVTTADGALRRMIVTPDAAVTTLDSPRTTPAPKPHPVAASATPKKPAGRHGLLTRFPERVRPVIRWGAVLMAVLVVASVVVMVVHGRGSTADAVAPAPTAPIPPAGQLYTEQAPPGWSQNAAWVIDLAEDAPTPVVAADGAVVAVTAGDNSAVPADGDDRYLSVLEPTGQTRWAVPLDTAPKTGPLVLSVDGAEVVLIAGARDITYWPLTGGPETVVPLPSSAKITPSGLVILPNERLGYLHAGTLQTVENLPRTDPGIALDGAVIVTQPGTGAWWTLSVGTAPTAVRPVPPPGAVAPDHILAVSADQILISWATTTPQDCTATAYQRTDGSLIASVTAPCSAMPRPGAAYAGNETRSGIGSLIQEGKSMITVPGLAVTTVIDQIYGTTAGVAVTVSPSGQITKLPDGTLIPAGQTNDQLIVVGSDNRLYALTKEK